MLKVLLRTTLLLSITATLLPAATSRPNILFIVADDMRADSIHALGNIDIQTPNIDRLVKDGSTFSQVYNMGSTVPDVGASSRAVMLSGRSLFRFSGDLTASLDDMPLLPEIMRKAGYATFATGKWQNGRGWFERSFSHGDEILFGDQFDAAETVVFDFDKSGGYPESSGHDLDTNPNEAFADALAGFMETRPRGQPFFAYLSFTLPKDAPANYLKLYSATPPPLPKNFARKRPPEFEEATVSTDDSVALHGLGDVRNQWAAYYAKVTHLDAQIGRVLDALKSSGVDDNTIIVFTADNGQAIGSHGLINEQNLYEHDTLVPFVLAGPGIPRGKRFISMCYNMDFYPTIAALTGAIVPASVEGKSLLPILTTQGSEIRATIYSAYTDRFRAIRDYRWKLIYHPKTDSYQLFNLRSDPGETNDLFSSGEYGRDINRLRIQMSAWQSSLDDPLR